MDAVKKLDSSFFAFRSDALEWIQTTELWDAMWKSTDGSTEIADSVQLFSLLTSDGDEVARYQRFLVGTSNEVVRATDFTLWFPDGMESTLSLANRICDTCHAALAAVTDADSQVEIAPSELRTILHAQPVQSVVSQVAQILQRPKHTRVTRRYLEGAGLTSEQRSLDSFSHALECYSDAIGYRHMVHMAMHAAVRYTVLLTALVVCGLTPVAEAWMEECPHVPTRVPPACCAGSIYDGFREFQLHVAMME